MLEPPASNKVKVDKEWCAVILPKVVPAVLNKVPSSIELFVFTESITIPPSESNVKCPTVPSLSLVDNVVAPFANIRILK